MDSIYRLQAKGIFSDSSCAPCPPVLTSAALFKQNYRRTVGFLLPLTITSCAQPTIRSVALATYTCLEIRRFSWLREFVGLMVVRRCRVPHLARCRGRRACAMLLPLLVANDGCEVCCAAVMAVLQRRCWAGGGSGKAVNSGEVTAVVIARICFYLYKFPYVSASTLRPSQTPASTFRCRTGGILLSSYFTPPQGSWPATS